MNTCPGYLHRCRTVTLRKVDTGVKPLVLVRCVRKSEKWKRSPVPLGGGLQNRRSRALVVYGVYMGVRDPNRLIGSSHEGDPQRRLSRITNSPKPGYHLWQ